jgi:NADH dehydrogenase/NADH:ubiquinone oxidoreductase subunit G
MSNNPLQRYFRRPALWVKLPTLGKWYTNGEVTFNERQEVQVFGITAIDEIMLNTPDALFNGHALETVINSCIPEVHDVKRLSQPDLDALFLGIKSATNNGKHEMTRTCVQCKHENTFDIQCNQLLDSMTYIEDSDTVINIDGDIKVHIKPYDFEMRSLLIQHQLEERKALSIIEKNITDNNLEKADQFARSLEKMSRLSFRLIADSVTAIEILGKDRQFVDNKEHIAEWMTNVNKSTSDAIVSAVNALNEVGPPKTTAAQCTNCGHTWTETLTFDPALFFSRR